MADYAFSYWLPRTAFTVQATTTDTPVPGAKGTFLQPRRSASIQPALEADLDTGRQHITVSVGALEKVTLEVGFSDDGYIESVNSEAGRDPVPLITLGADLVSAATSFLPAIVKRGMFARPPGAGHPAPKTSLEAQWGELNPVLAELEPALLRQCERFLDLMKADDATAEDVVASADAVDALQAQLALIGAARRSWIAARTVAHTTTATLHVSDLHRVDALPETLDAPPDAASDGILFVVVDPERADADAEPATSASSTDRLPLRRPRPATVAVYTKTDDGWSLAKDSVRRLHIVDEFSPTDSIDLDGSWWTSRSFGLGYHGDGSLKTLKITSTSTVGAATSAGAGLLTAIAAARKGVDDAPSADEQRLAQAEAQLKLLQTTTDLASLAATSTRAEELAVLEQLKKIREART